MFKLQLRMFAKYIIQFSSVAQSCPTLCDPMDCSKPGFPCPTISWSLFKPMSIESVMPSNHVILCRPLLLPPSIFPSIRSFQMSQLFTSDGQRIGVSLVRCLQITDPTFSNKVFACPLRTRARVCVCVSAGLSE